MKKKILGLIPVICLITILTLTRASAQSYEAKLVIPTAKDTRTVKISSQEIDFEQAFPNVNPGTKNKGLTITSAGIVPTEPSGNLGMFRSIKIYLTKSDGSNEVLIASNTNIPATAGNKIILNLTKQLKTEKGGDPSATIETIIGRLPGVTLSGGEIRVRGSEGAPLYIVDGFEKRDILGIDPSDILSVNVLKDASETGMYGSRGANGVIVVKTKAANSGVEKNGGSLGNFEKESKVTIKLEYVPRTPLTSESSVNISLGFKKF